jgi:hypothetical protein
MDPRQLLRWRTFEAGDEPSRSASSIIPSHVPTPEQPDRLSENILYSSDHIHFPTGKDGRTRMEIRREDGENRDDSLKIHRVASFPNSLKRETDQSVCVGFAPISPLDGAIPQDLPPRGR